MRVSQNRMRASLMQQNILLAVLVLFLGILGFYFVASKVMPSLDANAEAQANLLANTIAVYANSLSGVDGGQFRTTLKEPLYVEVYDKSPPAKMMHVKITYNENGDSHELPLIAAVEPFPKTKVSAIELVKEKGRNVYMKTG